MQNGGSKVRLWIVGKVTDDQTHAWEFQGVFDSEQKAIDACVCDSMFIGPAELNKQLPIETNEWVGAFFPMLKKCDHPSTTTSFAVGSEYTVTCDACGEELSK